MKKAVSILTAACLALSLAACSSGSPSSCSGRPVQHFGHQRELLG